MHKITLILLLIFFSVNIHASPNVQLIKKENTDSNTTLLVIGGIHGDEPGGYFAASVLATHYKVNSKNLWIVPNLNKSSVQANRRGINGDMNRKFSVIKKNDKDSSIVKEIKEIILSKQVSLVLNLHDGNGFYRKENKGNIFNPNAWGQTCVIDQCQLKQNQPFGNLNSIASTVTEKINKKLLKQHHTLDVKNTNTKFDDEAMQLSLTYFAVTNNKPAFAIESSKNLSSLSKKVFYQLLAIEEFMKIMEISFERDFDLNERNLDEILKNYGILRINNNISLDLSDIKKSLSFIPIKSKSNVFDFSHPLGSVKGVNGNIVVYIGNKKITTLKPQYFEIAQNCKQKFDVKVDGEIKSIDSSSPFVVNDDFSVIQNSNFRVNVIGFKAKKQLSESGIAINYKALDKDFSVDKGQKIYRVEFYKDGGFCSMSTAYFK
ncbi:M99 family carboxypeptidase catalytic domain-containing protein [Sulfurimonas sp.]|uniref:M99 family carboxypeptidase catalytic domain-containing protein n=1 Tax=Sulfurimonas sp. TaxID=2022749 RepID=UPI0035680D8D